MKIGVIGYGSIGKRHVTNLISSGIKEIILFRAKGKGNEFNLKEERYSSYFWDNNFDSVIVCSPPADHYKHLKTILNNDVNVLCEKPIVSKIEQLVHIKELHKRYKGTASVVFNMRYHPAVKRLKELLINNTIGEIRNARFFVGQYLPDWKPGTDYATSYSAIRNKGGGVVLDLLHEIDLAQYLIGGKVKNVFSIAGKYSKLNIETEDIAEIIYSTEENILISIHLDYLFRGYKREIDIIGDEGSITCDLYNNYIKVFNEKGAIVFDETFNNFERNHMYLELLNAYFKALRSKTEPNPLFSDAISANEIAFNILQFNKLI